MLPERRKVTVGELRKMLAEFDDDTLVSLSAGLHIDSAQYIGGGEVHLKLAEPSALLNRRFRAAYPEVIAAFFWPSEDTSSDNQTEYLEIF